MAHVQAQLARSFPMLREKSGVNLQLLRESVVKTVGRGDVPLFLFFRLYTLSSLYQSRAI